MYLFVTCIVGCRSQCFYMKCGLLVIRNSDLYSMVTEIVDQDMACVQISCILPMTPRTIRELVPAHKVFHPTFRRNFSHNSESNYF